MRIKKDVYYSLVKDCPIPPPECGGILGGDNGIINIFSLNESTNPSGCYSYSPDIDKLNSILASWSTKGIEFYGVFHTHFSQVYSLSIPDKEYIHQIMDAIPLLSIIKNQYAINPSI